MSSPDDSSTPCGLMRCTTCRGFLQPSGREPHRYICESCGQNFFVVMQLVPVDPAHRPLLPEVSEGERAK